MKNTDIAMIIMVAVISSVASYFIGNAILGDPNDRVETVSYMETINSNIEQPDAETFNSTALNPTVEVYVGNCGPLEVWNVEKRICELKDGLNDETAKEEKNDEESDEETDTSDEETDTSNDETEADDSGSTAGDE